MHDRLAFLLRKQYDLQTEAYGMDLASFEPERRVQFIKDMVLAATDELHEALNETSWKPWSSTFGEVNEDAYFGELIDLVHFVMNLLLVAYPSLSPEGLAAAIELRYLEKRKINVRRQEDGYDGKTSKCPNCRRALDDKAVFCRRVTTDEFEGEHRYYCAYSAYFYHEDGSAAAV